MRPYLILLFFLSANVLQARTNDSSTFRHCAHLCYVYAVPIGQFAQIRSNNFLRGKTFPASTGAFMYSIRITDQAGLAALIDGSTHYIDHGQYRDVLMQRYSKPGYYTTLLNYDPKDDVFSYGSFSIAAFYTFRTKFADVEPYISVGLAGISTGAWQNSYIVHRKKIGENYFDDVYTNTTQSNIFLYPGIGVRACRKIVGPLYATVGVQYNQGTTRYTLQERTVDMQYNEQINEESFSQVVSSLQLQAGLQCRWRRMHKYRPPHHTGKHEKRKE